MIVATLSSLLNDIFNLMVFLTVNSNDDASRIKKKGIWYSLKISRIPIDSRTQRETATESDSHLKRQSKLRHDNQPELRTP